MAEEQLSFLFWDLLVMKLGAYSTSSTGVCLYSTVWNNQALTAWSTHRSTKETWVPDYRAQNPRADAHLTSQLCPTLATLESKQEGQII